MNDAVVANERAGSPRRFHAARFVLPGLLVATLPLVDLALVRTCTRWDLPAYHWLAEATVGLMVGQLALLVLWLAEGKTPVTRRLLCLLAASPVAARLLAAITRPPADEWLGFLALFLPLVLGGCLLLRVLRHRRSARSSGTFPSDSSRSTRLHAGRQYSLSALLTATTATACLFALARNASFRFLDVAFHDEVVKTALVLAAVAVSWVVTLFSGNRSFSLRVVLPLAGIAVLCLLPAAIIPIPRMLLIGEAFVMLVAVAVLQVAGSLE